MATQTITARTVDQCMEDGSGARPAETLNQREGQTRDFLDKLGDMLWSVSLVVRPLLRGFVPPYEMQCLISEQLPRDEKCRIRAELTVGP